MKNQLLRPGFRKFEILPGWLKISIVLDSFFPPGCVIDDRGGSDQGVTGYRGVEIEDEREGVGFFVCLLRAEMATYQKLLLRKCG